VRKITGTVRNAQILLWVCVSLLACATVLPAEQRPAGPAAGVANAPPKPRGQRTSATTAKLEVISHGDRESNLIALTFDDGPNRKYVPRFLALLRAEKVEATFFLVGEQTRLYPDVARAIVADGHEVGNHSLTHKNLRDAPASVAESEIAGMQQLLKERLDVVPRVYRPAYGVVTDTVRRICRREHLALISWNVDPNDWRRNTTREMIVRNVLDNVSSGSIILFHATHEKTLEAVSDLIPILRYRGFEFATVSKLLRDRTLREEIRRFAPTIETLPAKRWKPKGPARYRSVPAEPSTPSIQTPPLPPP